MCVWGGGGVTKSLVLPIAVRRGQSSGGARRTADERWFATNAVAVPAFAAHRVPSGGCGGACLHAAIPSCAPCTVSLPQGAGDDEESWSGGLSAAQFWRHSEVLIAAARESEQACDHRVEQLIAQVPSRDARSPGHARTLPCLLTSPQIHTHTHTCTRMLAGTLSYAHARKHRTRRQERALRCTALHCTALHCTALHWGRWARTHWLGSAEQHSTSALTESLAQIG